MVGAPTIGSVQRYGYHMMPTTIVLTFDQALDAVTAEDAKDYRIIGPAGRTIAIKNAVYDAAALTVSLYPVKRISIHHRYELIVDGTAPHGLTNTRGQLLDGDDSGAAGQQLPCTADVAKPGARPDAEYLRLVQEDHHETENPIPVRRRGRPCRRTLPQVCHVPTVTKD